MTGRPHGASLDHATGIGGVDLSGGVALGSSFTDVPGGTADWTFSYANYNDQSGGAAIDISKADVTVSVTPYNVTYDATAHTATGTVSAVGPVNQSDLNLGGTTHTSAGTYNKDPWTFTDTTGNYNNTSGAVDDAIAQAVATVAVTGYTGVYDGARIARPARRWA